MEWDVGLPQVPPRSTTNFNSNSLRSRSSSSELVRTQCSNQSLEDEDSPDDFHFTSAIFFGPLNDGPGIFDPLNDGPEIFLTKMHKSPQKLQPTSVPRYNMPLAT